MQVLQITHTLSDWSALVDNNGQRVTLTYAQQPQNAAVLADADKVFNPPTVSVTAEDGTVLALADAQRLAITLTPTQKTRLLSDISDLQILVTIVWGKLPSDPAARALIRAHSPVLDALLSLTEGLT